MVLAGKGQYGTLQVVTDHIRNVSRPRMRRRSTGVCDDALSENMGVPGLHSRSLVGSRECGEHRLAGLDLGEIAFDDFYLVTLRVAAEVSPHGVDWLPSDLANESLRTPTVLDGVGRTGEIHPPHTWYPRRACHWLRVRSMGSAPRSTDFVALGHPGSEHFAGLETFANPGVSQVEMTSDELTAVCPVTAQPDLYVATIVYWPQTLCIESKSLKLYLSGFRNDAHFCEALTVKIHDEVAEVLDLPPDKVKVTLKQKARGGITIIATS